MTDFTGQVAFVTGGGAGIGLAVVEAFAAAGAKVVVADIDEKAGQAAADAVTAKGGEAIFVRCDVSDQASVNAAFDATIAKFGRVDCAVNNAGIDPEIYPEAKWGIDLFDKIHRVNVRGVALCMEREIAEMLKQGGGAIVNMGSFASLAGIQNKPYYVASKHAVLGITKSAALQYAAKGIRINLVAPGAVDTQILKDNIGQMAGDYKPQGGQPGAGRVSQPSEQAHAVLFLCDPKSSFIVGHALSVDGGIAAR
ncbi:glucose 1-dehydrogenase [Sphingomonas montanisoli]|uniref:Glucose 1-dehydrogenase n=1 Tax=Sphingomonas montanisoli TaxID=2606412 RepID=A0A5D9C7I5_9SPHN|nr:glucose 1-dehydrogenase [Sphingomonas montanisoli]TZG27838.1 glucose 1-dehydrogenase [Sphingomonas montanisoli]